MDIMNKANANTLSLSRRALDIIGKQQLGLDDAKWQDEQLIDAMLAHPILINRPIVVTPLGTRLCRPSELVLDILPNQQQAAFTKEDGEQVVNAQGERVAKG